MTSGLLAFSRTEGVAVLMSKTYFEQVSLETVRKIVEAQIRREQAAERDRATKQKTQGEVLAEMQEQSPASFRAFPHVEA
jgi:hypothetical protein